MRVLSIDWDFFVKEDPDLEWGHAEEQMFLDVMWQLRRVGCDKQGNITRCDLRKLAPFVGDPAALAVLPVVRRGGYRFVSSESHLAILQVIGRERNLEIINVDAHHDIFYKMPVGEFDVNSNISVRLPDCGSWGSQLMQEGRVKSWTQIYPEWRREHPEEHQGKVKWAISKGVDIKVTMGTFSPIRKWSSIDLLFVCRSGCWVPPEYDHKLEAFCERLGSKRTMFSTRSLDAAKFKEVANG